MEDTKYRENDTFRFGENSHLNACVGNNGYVDLFRYQDGYIMATKQLLHEIGKAVFNPDSMVYPILYSARHSLELFFKNQIHQLYHIEKIITGATNPIRMNTHDIDTLFSELTRLSNYDDRYKNYIDSLSAYVFDYIDVDNSGESFRYPESNDGAKSLSELYCVNLGIFAEKYYEMCDIIEDIENLTEYLYAEYSTESVVCGVSRDVIEQISQKLPARKDWGEPEFDKLKNEIITNYQISSNTFGKILNFIQNHHEFAANIGIELPLSTLQPTELREYLSIYDKFEARKSQSFMKSKTHYTEQILQNLRKEAIVSIAALRALAYQYEYSEAYGQLYSYFDNIDPCDIVFNNLVGFGSVKQRIKNSLQRLGQKSLLEEIK